MTDKKELKKRKIIDTILEPEVALIVGMILGIGCSIFTIWVMK